MNLLITICARGGSKGIPGKNILPLNGKPLLHYTLNHAVNFAKMSGADIQLSTDAESILMCANEFGYHTDYVRPDDHATDTAGKIGVIKHAWKYAEELHKREYDYLLDLDVTSPLRTTDDLNKAFELIRSVDEALNLFSVSPANRNPYFNMVEKKSDGYVKLVKDAGVYKSRQETPEVYDMNASFYIFTREYLTSDYFTSVTDRSLPYVMDHICFDLDHPVDFKVMEIMLRENLLDFEL